MAMTEGSPVRNQNDEVSPTPSSDSRHTGLRVAIGIVSIVVGILLIARPASTLIFVAILVGVQLVLLGAVRILLAAAASGPSRWSKVVSILFGILTIVAGVICFIRPNAPLVLIAILLAVGWIADGLSDVVRAFSQRTEGIDKTYALLAGVLSVAAGFVVALFPGESLELLTRIAGIALLVIGAFTCLSAITRRRRGADR